MSTVNMIEDILSLVTLRLFAKRKKGIISESDFATLADLGAQKAIGIVSVRSDARHFEEMVAEEIRKAVELISKATCGRCRGTGICGKTGIRFVICGCVNMVHYRGDSVLPLGEQYSNAYFEGELSKTELGRKATVQNICTAVSLFLLPHG